ncbi:MAG: methylenetetrahydrofolate reductase [NAD(P)H] [Coprobacillus sp.]
MKISEILKNKATLSFEVFPPKNKEGDISSIYHTIDELSKLKPDFISVTYGAGGSTKGKTVEIASKIKNDYHIESVAHLTCISSTKEEILEMCKQLKEKNIENILSLRGDYPQDSSFQKENLEFHYAKDLNTLITKEFKGDFCLSGACYPEVHNEAACFEDDLKALKEKVDSGAEYLITQIFFDNQYYYRLVKEARKRGITVPILAGIMPITNSKSLLNTAKLCSCSVPYQLSTMIESYYHYPSAMKEIGINYATHQIIDLITNGVDGIHIYTMNKPEIAKAIFDNIPTVLKELNHE